MRCKTEQREGSRSVDPRVSSHHGSAPQRESGGSRKRAEINDHPLERSSDRIRLIAIKMKGVFGNEDALPLLGCELAALAHQIGTRLASSR